MSVWAREPEGRGRTTQKPLLGSCKYRGYSWEFWTQKWARWLKFYSWAWLFYQSPPHHLYTRHCLWLLTPVRAMTWGWGTKVVRHRCLMPFSCLPGKAAMGSALGSSCLACCGVTLDDAVITKDILWPYTPVKLISVLQGLELGNRSRCYFMWFVNSGLNQMEWEFGSSSQSTKGAQGSLCCVMVFSESKSFHLTACPDTGCE